METVDFLNVCENQTRLGRKIYVPDYLSSGKYPIIDQSKKYIVAYTNEDDGLYSNVPFVIFGDVTRVIKYIDFPCFLGADGSVIVKVINPDFNTKYVYYALLNSYIPDTGFNRHYKFLKDIKIKKYTLNEQEKIVFILDKINEAIKLERKRLSLLDELIKSRFIEMFNKEQNSEKLVDLCKFINGDRGKNYPSANDRIETGIPFINAGHLNNNLVCFDDMDYISETKYESLSSGKVQQNDIIYCLRGSLGKKAIVTFDKGAIASSLLILRANNKIRPLFLLYSLEQEYVLSQMEMSNNGSSQPNLSAQSVKQYNILLPSLNKQIEFEKFVKLIDKLKFKVQGRIESLTELLNKKMDEFFGGDD